MALLPQNPRDQKLLIIGLLFVGLAAVYQQMYWTPKNDELNIIADQVGTPTYAVDLAGAILDIIGSGHTAYGVYHYSNEGVTSWYDFAMGIFDLSSTEVKVNPIPTSQYPTRAVRPKFSVMDKTKIKATFGLTIPYWRESLKVCIARLATQS